MRLVDTRWAGIAKGVGTQKILGIGICVVFLSCTNVKTNIVFLVWKFHFIYLGMFFCREGSHGPDPDRTRISYIKVISPPYVCQLLRNQYSCRKQFSTSRWLNISSFSILEAQPMDMLLGLDMLKKHQVETLNLFLSQMFLLSTVSSVHDRPAEKLPDDRHNRNRNQISLRKRAATMREVIWTVYESSLLRFGSSNDKISFPNSISGSQQPRKMPPGI